MQLTREMKNRIHEILHEAATLGANPVVVKKIRMFTVAYYLPDAILPEFIRAVLEHCLLYGNDETHKEAHAILQDLIGRGFYA